MNHDRGKFAHSPKAQENWCDAPTGLEKKLSDADFPAGWVAESNQLSKTISAGGFSGFSGMPVLVLFA